MTAAQAAGKPWLLFTCLHLGSGPRLTVKCKVAVVVSSLDAPPCHIHYSKGVTVLMSGRQRLTALTCSLPRWHSAQGQTQTKDSNNKGSQHQANSFKWLMDVRILQGELLRSGPWWDIGQQSPQPLFYKRTCGEFTAEISHEESFLGGASLRITGEVCPCTSSGSSVDGETDRASAACLLPGSLGRFAGT